MLQLSFGETPLTPVKVAANGIAEVWLPLIGEEETLLAFTGKQKKSGRSSTIHSFNTL